MRVFVDSKGRGLEMGSARVSGCTRLICALRHFWNKVQHTQYENEPRCVAAAVKYWSVSYNACVYDLWLRLCLPVPVTGGALANRHRASCILGQAFRYSPEKAFYIFNQQIYFII